MIIVYLAIALNVLADSIILSTYAHWNAIGSVGNKNKMFRQRSRPDPQDQDHDRHWSETGLVI